MPRHTKTGEFSLYHVSSLRRPISLIAQAVGVLAKHGGSLWVSDPAYTSTSSDGTGAAGDNSDAGYVRDLCGNARPLTQSTTGFKPKLQLVGGRWAWVFDGADDYMASAASSLSQSPDYTLVVAFNSRNRSGYRLALGVFAPGGQDHMALIGEAGESPVLTQYSRDISGSGGPTPSVVTGVSSSVGGRKLRKNGAVVASAAYHPLTIEPRSILMGLGIGGDNLTGEIFAAAYAPAAIPDAELLIVERAMSQLAGVTI